MLGVSSMSHYIHPLQQQQAFNVTKQKNVKKPQGSFANVLDKQQNLKVSKHAQQRLSERNIQINDEKWQQISAKMQEASKKGVTDSVVVTEDATLIVSNKNNTVVTALNHDEADNKIFTNINGMILLK